MAKFFITNKEEPKPPIRIFKVLRAPKCYAYKFYYIDEYIDMVHIEGDGGLVVGSNAFTMEGNKRVVYSNKVFTMFPNIKPTIEWQRADNLEYFVTDNEGIITRLEICNR